MRPRELLLATLGWLLLALHGAGCRSAPEPLPPSPPQRAAAVGEFSSELAWQHLLALTAIGPRASGTEGALRARDYIESQLAKIGLESEAMEFTVNYGPDNEQSAALVNVLASVPGESASEIVLVAPYDTPYTGEFEHVGAHDGASGVAVLLELARVIGNRPLPYTTTFAFLDGEARFGRGTERDARVHGMGASALAKTFAATGRLANIRLLVVIERVGDADLHIARDLRSHRNYRNEFWRAASKLGRRDVFDPDAEFDSTPGSHLAFVNHGLRPVVALKDVNYLGEAFDDGPPDPGDTPEKCSPDSLAAVGEVTLEALDAISRRLARIDRFAEEPLTAVVGPEEVPEAEEPSEAEPAPAPAEIPEPPPPPPAGGPEPPPAPEAPAGEAQ